MDVSYEQIPYEQVSKWFDHCWRLAIQSKCLKSKCGAIIVNLTTNAILGEGYNAPPNNTLPSICIKEHLSANFKSEHHCCIHAEQNAILMALENGHKQALDHSRMYFVRLDDHGKIQPSGKPYCTICSKMADHYHIEWCLWHKADVWGKEGCYIYPSNDYNRLSFEYRQN